MPRDFMAGEVTVYVWSHRGPQHPGHAAVKLTGIPGADRAYISWWPADGAGLSNAFQSQGASAMGNYKEDMRNEMAPRTRERLEDGTFSPQVGADGRGQRLMTWHFPDGSPDYVWGQDADEKIKLPPLGRLRRPFGLDTVRMYDWWNVFQSCPHPRYQYASKSMNCAGVAAAALKVGGAEAFVAAPKAVLYLDPNQIAKWARQVRAEIDRRNEEAATIEDAVYHSGDPIPDADPNFDLMSYDEWKQLSSKNTGLLDIRSQKIRQIDGLIKDYHAYEWSVGLPKFEVLGKIMDVIHQCVASDPTGKRGDALLTLGKQVIVVARHLADVLDSWKWDLGDQALWTAKT
jgi:hypothetical protein